VLELAAIGSSHAPDVEPMHRTQRVGQVALPSVMQRGHVGRCFALDYAVLRRSHDTRRGVVTAAPVEELSVAAVTWLTQ
jgi:hypothetical protein